MTTISTSVNVVYVIIILSFIACSVIVTGNIESKAGGRSSHRFPIVYLYTILPEACDKGVFPLYIVSSLQQCILTQPDADIIMASNFGSCKRLAIALGDAVNDVTIVDTSAIESNRTTAFRHMADNIFMNHTHQSALWKTSAIRFLSLEDLMIDRGYTSMLHVEADNILYGSIIGILNELKNNYVGLAATPLSGYLAFITASVFWVSDLKYLVKFNDYLLRLGEKGTEWIQYIDFIRSHAELRKLNGYLPNFAGWGVKMYSINEMSMLAYYYNQHPTEFHLLPVLPRHSYVNRYQIKGKLTDFIATGNDLWDPNSYGQYLGGTSSGKNKGFVDVSHIVGQAIQNDQCTPEVLCSNRSISSGYKDNNKDSDPTCFTAVYVKCGNSHHTLLYNLHVHNKHVHAFISKPCKCTALD